MRRKSRLAVRTYALCLLRARANTHSSLAGTMLAGFAAVECGAEIYQFSREELRKAKNEASVQQVLVNAPVGT